MPIIVSIERPRRKAIGVRDVEGEAAEAVCAETVCLEPRGEARSLTAMIVSISDAVVHGTFRRTSWVAGLRTSIVSAAAEPTSWRLMNQQESFRS